MDGSISEAPGEHEAAIPMLVSDIAAHFVSLAAAVVGETHVSHKITSTSVEDEFSRYKLWAGNIAAHRRGKRSLAYRLRDATHLLNETLSLLDALKKALGGALEIVRGERKPWEELSGSDSDDSTDSGLQIGLQGDTELEQLFGTTKSLVTSLFRLSMSIREPAPNDQSRSTITVDKLFFEPYDILHVKAKFPVCPDYLAERLGRAISARRQYLNYRETHHQKLSRHIESIGSERPKTEGTANSTEATPIIPAKSVQPTEVFEERDDALSQTSYATSINSTLKVPPLPKSAREGEIFECHLCYLLVSITTNDEWKKHVYRDLHPYCCTFEHCTSADRLYDSRRSWFSHELEAHRTLWQCVEGCDKVFASRQDFQHHAHEFHPELATTVMLPALIATSAKTPGPHEQSHCLLCGKKMALKSMHKHLGAHQAQLALFALPSAVEEDADDDANETRAREMDASLEESDAMSDPSSPGHELPKSTTKGIIGSMGDKEITLTRPVGKQGEYHWEEPVSETLLPIHSQLSTMRRRLLEAKEVRDVSSFRDLYTYNEKLHDINNMRVSGKFMVGTEIPSGQESTIRLLEECFQLVLELRNEAERGSSADNDEVDQPARKDEIYSGMKGGSAVPQVVPVHMAGKQGSRLSLATSESGASSSDRQSQSNRTDEIRLRVDNNAPISLQLTGDMEGRMLRLIPGEDGTTDVVIVNRDDEFSDYSEHSASGVRGQAELEGLLLNTHGVTQGALADADEDLSQSSLHLKDSSLNLERRSRIEKGKGRAIVPSKPEYVGEGKRKKASQVPVQDESLEAKYNHASSTVVLSPKQNRVVGFNTDPTTSISRPVTTEESWAAYHFETHASKCPYCHDPCEVHRNHEQLCDVGHRLAQEVARHMYNRSDGVTYSTTSEDNKSVQIEIPSGYLEVRSLLKAIERSLRHRSRQPFVSMDRSYYVVPKASPALQRSQSKNIEHEQRPRIKTSRPRAGEVVDWPGSQTKSKRVLAEISTRERRGKDTDRPGSVDSGQQRVSDDAAENLATAVARARRGRLYDEEEMAMRRKAKKYAVEVREPTSRDLRDHRFSGYYR